MNKNNFLNLLYGEIFKTIIRCRQGTAVLHILIIASPSVLEMDCQPEKIIPQMEKSAK
jgi:hypothetical protein